MAEPMSDERLAEIRADSNGDRWEFSYDGGDAVRELLAEVNRLRAERDGQPETRCPVLSTTRLRLQCSRPEGHDAAHVAELDGMGRFSWHGAAERQPEDGDRG